MKLHTTILVLEKDTMELFEMMMSRITFTQIIFDPTINFEDL